MVMILGMNGGGVARNGLILWENDATGSGKVFRLLPGPWEAIKNSKNKKNGNGENDWKFGNSEYSEYSPY